MRVDRAHDDIDSLRVSRNRLLAASDWTQMSDCPLTDQAQAAWKAYRQALRDLPAKAADPSKVIWPAPPR